MDLSKRTYTVLERFLRYVAYDTQSAEESETFPSTGKQKILGQVLVDELKTIGLADAHIDEFGYVMATLEANVDRAAPVIGLIAHMDTSPDVSGQDVKPQIHANYRGGDILLSSDPAFILKESENLHLKDQIGHDIITSDGTTLLGADNKAGIAEIFDAVTFLVQHPELQHGKIRVAVTPDEEVGRGAEHFDLKAFNADYAYTIDGETVGEVENETFCADSFIVIIHGVNVHPGYAKNKMVNSIKIAADLIGALPKERLSPETTEKREGYVHPNTMQAGVEKTTINFLVRDFTVEGLKHKESFLLDLALKTQVRYPGCKIECKVKEYYRNMKYKLDEDPRVVEIAVEAVRRSGITPRLNLIRGGTDGARLSFDGLLTPNIFTGGHNFHSKFEWISVQDMQKAVDVIINLILLWAEQEA